MQRDIPGVLPDRPEVESDEAAPPEDPESLVEAAVGEVPEMEEGQALLIDVTEDLPVEALADLAHRYRLWVRVETPSEETMVDLLASGVERVVLPAPAADLAGWLEILEPEVLAVEADGKTAARLGEDLEVPGLRVLWTGKDDPPEAAYLRTDGVWRRQDG